jgi:hypothetical protein
MMQGVADGIGKMFTILFILCIIFVPLGAWKMIEIIIWLFQHIKIEW